MKQAEAVAGLDEEITTHAIGSTAPIWFGNLNAIGWKIIRGQNSTRHLRVSRFTDTTVSPQRLSLRLLIDTVSCERTRMVVYVFSAHVPGLIPPPLRR